MKLNMAQDTRFIISNSYIYRVYKPLFHKYMQLSTSQCTKFVSHPDSPFHPITPHDVYSYILTAVSFTSGYTISISHLDTDKVVYFNYI